MTWTTEKPTQPGWYWFKDQRVEPDLYDVFETSSGGLALEASGEVFAVELFDGEWAGPLKPPKGTP